MELMTKLSKLEFLAGFRTYLGIGGFWLASLAEWNGFDVPGFVALDPVNTFWASLVALGIYEKAKA